MKKNIIFFLLASFLFIVPTITFAADLDLGVASTKLPILKQIEDARDYNEVNKSPTQETQFAGTKTESGLWEIIQGAAFESLAGRKSNENNTREGALGIGGKMIGQLFSHPAASTQLYIADLQHSLNIAQPAYAQGLGFASLSPILSTWKLFRNIAYLGFAVIFLIIGFMIMTRQKVGQAAITAQQALPKIVIALIAVTFSYAIAGLLIDAMYLIMQMIIVIFGSTINTPILGFQGSTTIDLNSSIFAVGGAMILGASGSAKDIIGDFVANAINLGDVAGGGLAWITSITAALIIAVAATFAVFKVFFELVKTYVTIILTIVLAPIQLMAEAMPGQSTFKQWIQGLIGNLAAFPTVLIILVLFKILTENTIGSTGGFMPPFLLGNSGTGDLASFLIAFGLLLGMPEAITQVKKTLKASDGGAFGQVMNSGLKRASEAGTKSIQYGPHAALQPYGIGKGAITGGWKQRGGGNIISGAWSGAKKGSAEQIPKANKWARTVANIKDGKFADPNSWENVLLAQAREQQKKELEEKKKRESEKNPVTG